MAHAPLSVCLCAAVLSGCAYTCADSGCGYVQYRSSPLMLWEDAWRPPPAMKADRAVNEQDCTRPIANPAANLKCK
jgi:hypothetical protein